MKIIINSKLDCSGSGIVMSVSEVIYRPRFRTRVPPQVLLVLNHQLLRLPQRGGPKIM